MTDAGNVEGSVSDAAEKIAREAEGVRERVSRLVTDAVGGRGLGDLRSTVSEILEGVTKSVKAGVEDERRGVLREAVGGISDGLESAANATRLAIEEAEGRGKSFAKEDLRQAADDLRTLESMLVDTVSGLSSKLGSESKEQVRDLVEHARRAASSMRPSIEAAIEAATKDPGRLAGEAAGAGADAARGALGSLLGAASGLLDAAAEAVSGEKKPRNEENSGDQKPAG
jgi:hypothetical protein